VVVGQKVDVKFVYDPVFDMDMAQFSWQPPSGGLTVRNYIANDNVGKIITHESADYKNLQFEYYYTNKYANVGSIYGGSVILTDPNGVVHYTGASASFYVETPTVKSFTSHWATWNPYEYPVGVRPYNAGEDNRLILGGTPRGKSFSEGITWTANVGAPPVIGGGHIAYNQQISIEDLRRYNNNVPKQKDIWMQQGFVLDGTFPYDDYLSTSVSNALVSQDTPWCKLQRKDGTQSFDAYRRQDSFKVYLIYKPVGTSTIWVTLSVIHWGWSGTASYNATTDKWQVPFPAITGGGNGVPSSSLPEWDKRINPYSNNQNEHFKWIDI